MVRRRIVFLAAVALIALHVLDDSFIQPEDGTSAADHLISGLVPVALIIGAASWHPRARGGIRAILEAALGLFGITVGVEGWNYLIQVEPTGDDFTGLLAVPAGLVLLAMAVQTLWTTRRRDGRPLWRYTRRSLIGVASVVVTMLFVAPFLAAYLYTHIGRAVVPAANLGTDDYEDVTFETSDGLTLRGWYLPSTNGAVVIAFAGRTHPQNAARFLSAHGYGVLLFDRRGEGESDGDPNAFGWGGGEDIKAAIAYLKQRPDVDDDRIGGIGYSVGGEMMIEVAAETDDLKAVVSEGAGVRSVREATLLPASDWMAYPVWTATTAGAALFANALPPANLKDLVGEIAPRPVFLIYAEQGQGGEELSQEFYEAAGEPKQLWMTDSSHVGGYDADPEEYERRVVEFFDGSIGPGASGS